MPKRKMDPKMIKRNEIAMAEYRKCKKLLADGKMSEATFKKNFRGAVALRTGTAYKHIDEEYRAWLKKNGHPMPKPARPKKKRARKSKKKDEQDKK